MADTEMLLFIDFETTGLLEDKRSPGALEVAWTVTSGPGNQLSPLKQAFCALPIGEDEVCAPQTGIDPDTGETWAEWEDDGETAPHLLYPSPVVREMHEKNGLLDDYGRIATAAPDRILRSWAELERLILDDLRDAGFFELARHQVQLAGAGVAHYESRFLPSHLPRIFKDTPDPNASRWHYAAHDVSGILRGLRTADRRVPDKVDGLLAVALPPTDWGWGQMDWPSVEIGGRYDATDRCSYTLGGEPRTHWARRTETEHRAAPDVARTLMAHRLLSKLPGMLADLTPAG